MNRIEEASLDEAIQIVLDPKVFPDEGEFQTVCGYYKDEIRAIGEVSKRTDVALTFDPESMRRMLTELLIGYPHHCVEYISERYGYDVRDLED